jgi:ribose/xylose/arabinose/galactoside ABC-type transport system permease subunit
MVKDEKGNFNWREFWIKYQVWIIFIGLTVVYGIISPHFFTSSNIKNILTQNAMLVVVSLAQLLAVITGGIDLSVAAILAMSGIFTAKFIVAGTSVFLAIIYAAGIGAIAGSISGLLVSKLKFAPFIATLATMVMVKGVTFIQSGGHVIYVTNDTFQFLGEGSIIGIPVLVWIAIIITAIVWFILQKTVIGRRLYAVGGNVEAAHLAGINVQKYQFCVYMFSGLLCGLAGAFMACRLGAGSPTIASEWEMDSIAAVVVGGASLAGGIGTAPNSMIGALIMGFIRNILNLLGVAAYPQLVIKGLIIIASVLSQGIGSGAIKISIGRPRNKQSTHEKQSI